MSISTQNCQALHQKSANVFILFHQDDKPLKYFHDTHISGDMDFKEFKAFCGEAWNKKHGFAVINLWEEPYCEKYFQNYETIYTPAKYLKQVLISSTYIHS